jgi:hypothetical protein
LIGQPERASPVTTIHTTFRRLLPNDHRMWLRSGCYIPAAGFTELRLPSPERITYDRFPGQVLCCHPVA